MRDTAWAKKWEMPARDDWIISWDAQKLIQEYAVLHQKILHERENVEKQKKAVEELEDLLIEDTLVDSWIGVGEAYALIHKGNTDEVLGIIESRRDVKEKEQKAAEARLEELNAKAGVVKNLISSELGERVQLNF